MPVNIPSMGNIETLEDMKNYVYSLERTLKYLLGGYLNSSNISEIGGWIVGDVDLSSQNGSVGMTSLETIDNDIRFWAGDPNKATAPFRVYEDGTVIANKLQSKSVSSPTTITNTLTAQKAYIAELTVDELDTSTKVQKYLVSDTTDVNYIKIKAQSMEWITATVLAGLPTEQVKNRKGDLLYWLDATKTGATLDVTQWPIMVYQYLENAKRKISFESVAGTYIPMDTIGDGNDIGSQGQAFIRKVVNGIEFEYIAEGTAASRKITLNNDGIFINPWPAQSDELDFGVEANRPSALPNVEKQLTTFAAAGLGYRASDSSLWSTQTGSSNIEKHDTNGTLLDTWAIGGGANGCEIDGDNNDFIWITRNSLVKYQISTKTLISNFSVGIVNGVCAPAGAFVWVGLNSPNEIIKVNKSTGAIVLRYSMTGGVSDLAWDGKNIWVSYADKAVIEAYDPVNGFTFVRSFIGPSPNHPGLTFDGTRLWAAYPDGNPPIVSKLMEGSNPLALYYATDTKKLYWNVNGTWTLVGGVSAHAQLTGLTNDDHTQYLTNARHTALAHTWLALTDTPSSFTGQKGKVVSVNPAESGLEFTSVNASSIQGKVVPSLLTTDDKKLLSYDSVADAMKWVVPGTGADASFITGVPVDATLNKTDGFVLTYDAVSGKLVLKPKPAGGGGGTALTVSTIRVVPGIVSLSNSMVVSRVDNLQDPWYPKNLKITQIPNTVYDMRVTWDRDAQANITGYNVYLNNVLNNPSPLAQPAAGTNLTYTITGFARGAACNIAVRSIADGVEGLASTASATPGSAVLIATMTSNTAPAPLVASATTEYSGLPAWQAFDSNLNTLWSSVSGLPNVWLKIDLGAGNSSAPTAIDLRARTDGFATQTPKDFRLEGSNDDVTYTTLGTFSGQIYATGEMKHFTLPDNFTTYRYLRLWVTANNADVNVSLSSLVWYG